MEINDVMRRIGFVCAYIIFTAVLWIIFNLTIIRATGISILIVLVGLIIKEVLK